MALYENKTETERALLVSVDTGDFDALASIDELEELLKTAGGECVGKIIQKKEAPEKATYVGKGKLAEILVAIGLYDVNLLVFDSELSPSQERNLSDITKVRVIDRTTLILDIFAQRARSSEGKIQVELAQLKYKLPRLSGQGISMSRLGGGIGTRGPGETKLESDKRHIRRRIDKLQEELSAIEKRRAQTRKRREKDSVQSVAIVGYTNAGKSTLMNALTDAGVLSENKLFATLDPTARGLTLPDGRQIMLIDTVGFIRRLPHKLVEAFKSTLEEASSATLVLNVCDASDEYAAEHLQVTKEILTDLGFTDRPIISVMNKCDLVGDIYNMHTFGKTVMISALEKKGLDELLLMIQNELPPTRKTLEVLLPFSEGGLANRVRTDGAVIFEEYRPEGLYMKATVDISMIPSLQKWIL